MRTLLGLVCALFLASVPLPVNAWGLEVHRLLTARALDGLPGDLKPFFADDRAFVIEHAVDPDLWRVAGLRTAGGEEGPNHFFDIDDLGEPPPFRNVPRTWETLVQAFGADRANQVGRLPWRAEEIVGRLTTTFAQLGRPNAPPYAAENARYLAAILAHYAEDAHQPLHTTGNYDGQHTGQRGLHSRYETTLVLRHRDALRLAPVAIVRIDDVPQYLFDAIVRSQSRVAAVLAADRRAAAGRDAYDDGYFDALFAAAQPGLEQQLSDASSAVASLITQAWEQAGRPPLRPKAAPRPPARISR
jgi:hypothetical protein